MRLKHLIRGTASAAVLIAVACSGVAYAQEPSVAELAEAEEEDEATNVGGLIVTAQKREQRLQDVPIVVTSVSEQLLEGAGVRDIKDLTILTPGLIVTSTSNETVTTARIRGVGTVGDNPGLESSVGVVIDGVYRPRNGVGFGDLGPLERVEVLKGPQGTLFGKNTSSGVINIITEDPSFNRGVEVELTAGNFDYRSARLSVTGPIMADTLAGSLFFAHGERDGFYDVVARPPRTEVQDATMNYYTTRGQLLWLPNETTSARIIVDYTKRDEHCCLSTQINTGPLAPVIQALTANNGIMVPAMPFERRAFSNRPTDQEIRDQGISAEVDWDTPWWGSTLTSITALRNWSTSNGQDSDFTGADLLYRNPDGTFGSEFDQFSQELRLAGSNGRLDWLVGGFFAREDLSNKNFLGWGTQLEQYLDIAITGPAGLSTFTGLPAGTNFPAGGGSFDQYDQESTSFALFTNNTFRVTDRLELTLGLRATKESKEVNTLYDTISGTPACSALLARELLNASIFGGAPGSTDPAVLAAGRASSGYALVYGIGCLPSFTPGFADLDSFQESEEEDFSGTLKAAYRWSENLMTYASYARGYKAGGFNLDRARDPVQVPNPVVGQPPSNSFVPLLETSFPEETVDSYEIGAKTNIGDNFLFNVAAFHQTYEGFQLNTFTGLSFIVASIPEVESQGVDADFVWFAPFEGLSIQGGATYTDTKYGQFVPGPGVSPRLPGSRMSFAPKFTGSLAVDLRRDIANDLMLMANFSARYNSEYNTGSDLHPDKMQGAYVLANARLGLGSADERWAVEVWGQNLNDEEYYQVVFDATFQSTQKNAFLGAPRTYGVTLKSKF